MTREEAIDELKRIGPGGSVAASDDFEKTHNLADNVLCDLLTTLGYEDVVYRFNQVNTGTHNGD